MTKKESKVPEPYYVKLAEDHGQSYKEYVFRVDEARRRVTGTVKMTMARIAPYIQKTTWKDPATGRRVVRYNAVADLVEWPFPHSDKAVVRCSARDTWDPVVGIAVCKLKLDVRQMECFGIPETFGWPKFKNEIKLSEVVSVSLNNEEE